MARRLRAEGMRCLGLVYHMMNLIVGGNGFMISKGCVEEA